MSNSNNTVAGPAWPAGRLELVQIMGITQLGWKAIEQMAKVR